MSDLETTEDATISVVASGYDVSCSCGTDLGHGVQLDSPLFKNKGWFYQIECPDCHTIHDFDGGDIEHAF
jgi:hypothetical protein